jgi:hypothetical protein
LDIKYVLCGFDKNLPSHLVAPHAALERTTRREQPARMRFAAVPLWLPSPSKPRPAAVAVAAKAAAVRVKKHKPTAHQSPPKRKLARKSANKRANNHTTAAASASAASVRSTPSACSSTASSIVTYVPKEIAVPVALPNGDITQDKNPPLFSPLTMAGGASALRKKKAPTMMTSSSSSAGGGPPSVIEDCYMSDDEDPSALERTATTPNTDGPSAMMLDSHSNNDDDSPNEDLSTEVTYTKNKLRGVFEDDRKNASQFIDSVVESSQDYNRFSSLLNQALLQNDGALDLVDISHYMDGGDNKTYSDEQIQHFLQHMCAQNQIMRSDDVIYSM